ncbi:hypothetical protein JCM5176_13550 [Streptococcus sobrinus]|uniref:Uncharacterized protein n=1 Tax=Streptococcus sobrinus W1703 TaxID=1227275 RepID=U2IR20_9STRE|nr:hypothetical protein DK181_03680 [Streptococcus sobrinus]ERJ76371.1 hypothetical protein HMPREF1557_01066 [Streptococcus sobrinus W1703]
MAGEIQGRKPIYPFLLGLAKMITKAIPLVTKKERKSNFVGDDTEIKQSIIHFFIIVSQGYRKLA